MVALMVESRQPGLCGGGGMTGLIVFGVLVGIGLVLAAVLGQGAADSAEDWHR
jgi:hypothetical protein